MPPVKPMLAKSVPTIPAGMRYEPKWDGFRAIIFRDGDEIEIASRNTRPITRYFPEVVEAIRANLPDRCVVDGEIVTVVGNGLDFETLQQRIHPAASRVTKLAVDTPASLIAFDLLAVGDEDLTGLPFDRRRARLEAELAAAAAPVHVTPATGDEALAARWFDAFEGAGLDGLVAKPADGTYQPDKRTMFKIKHARTADCVLAGYRTHKTDDHAIGSLLLGLYSTDESTAPPGTRLAAVGVAASFPMARRRELFTELAPLVTSFDDHPWAWAEQEAGNRTPRESEGSRWSAGKDLSFTPLCPERVLEVRFDHLEGVRFRHTTQFVRWRDDRDPTTCTYAQMERPVTFDLAEILTR